MTPALLLDVLLVALLAATIAYLVVLNRRLAGLRENRAEIERQAREFAVSTARAEASVVDLKAAAEGTGRSLQECTERSQTLRDDLEFMIDRGNSLADRLESNLRQGRDAVTSAQGGADGIASINPGTAEQDPGPVLPDRPRPIPRRRRQAVPQGASSDAHVIREALKSLR
jgi:hypothetical protein